MSISFPQQPNFKYENIFSQKHDDVDKKNKKINLWKMLNSVAGTLVMLINKKILS
jgi:hypothetical protein